MVLYDVGSYHLQFQTTHQKKEMMRIEIMILIHDVLRLAIEYALEQ